MPQLELTFQNLLNKRKVVLKGEANLPKDVRTSVYWSMYFSPGAGVPISLFELGTYSGHITNGSFYMDCREDVFKQFNTHMTEGDGVLRYEGCQFITKTNSTPNYTNIEVFLDLKHFREHHSQNYLCDLRRRIDNIEKYLSSR